MAVWRTEFRPSLPSYVLSVCSSSPLSDLQILIGFQKMASDVGGEGGREPEVNYVELPAPAGWKKKLLPESFSILGIVEVAGGLALEVLYW
ncbi:hypothetical protein KSP39_PZI015748 [Platanthera zijinensis]|uniref:Uncharacterized protein n=1 Tax=Platanthera zijinensis TaxID=2320716 RepID=A0AAP0B9A4_9ASPA